MAAESFLNVVPRWGFGLMVLPMGSCSCGAGEKQVSAPEKSTVPLMPQWPGRPCAMPSPEVYPMAWTAGTFYCCDAALHPKLLKNNNFSSTESPNQATNNCNESTPCTNTTPPSFCPLVPSRCPLSGRAAQRDTIISGISTGNYVPFPTLMKSLGFFEDIQTICPVCQNSRQ